MGTFLNTDNQFEFNFSFDRKAPQKTKKEIVEAKMYRKIHRNNFKFRHKINNNKELIHKLVNELSAGDAMQIVSNSIDSPNIINSFIDRIELLYIATWSITPAGIACLENIAVNGVSKECVIVLDKTHSYKWMFSSGAYAILKDKVKIRLAMCHAKFLVMKLTDGSYLNFIGSMNLSNNPRWENILITKCKDDFDFYRDFIETIPCEQLKYTTDDSR